MAAELKTVTRCCISTCSYSKTLRTNAPEGGQRQHCILSHSWFLHITTGAVPWDELSKLNSHHDTGRDQLKGGHVVPCPQETEETRWELGTSTSLWKAPEAGKEGVFGELMSVACDNPLLHVFSGSLFWTSLPTFHPTSISGTK